jgi:ubiquitin-like protein Pup
VSGAGRIYERSDAHDRDGETPPVAPAAATSRPLLDDVDGLLDEIDAVLEVNAEEFVRGYVQKGGE